MKLPKIGDLSVCEFCKAQFKSPKVANIKKCTCSEYVYSTYPPDAEPRITSIVRSIQAGKDVYVLTCDFVSRFGLNNMAEEKQQDPDKIKKCKLRVFENGDGHDDTSRRTFKKHDFWIPDGMLEKIPLLEKTAKIVKFCRLVKLLD